jgi:glucan phosphoethanolaminetransferase (alkaline phosphatase superfamily)
LSIVFIFIVIILIVGIILLTSMKDEVLTMSKLRNIYLYLVSFVALMMIIIGLIFTVQNITDVLFPTNYYYDTLPIDKNGSMTEAEKKIYEENRKTNEQNQKTQSKKDVAKSVAVVLIALPTFAYHWRKIEKEKKEQV